jgi:hypothetical protein
LLAPTWLNVGSGCGRFSIIVAIEKSDLASYWSFLVPFIVLLSYITLDALPTLVTVRRTKTLFILFATHPKF